MNLKRQEPCEHCGASLWANNQPHQLPVGTELAGQYLVGRVLGQGGFAVTYLGWDQKLRQRVAIKEFFPEDLVRRESFRTQQVFAKTEKIKVFHWFREKFLHEAQLLAQGRDIPQVAQVYNFFEANNTAYIVMEYVEGTNLRDYVKDHGPMSPGQTLELLRPILKALVRLHQKGIIHRDIAPDNLILCPDGTVKLLDFGIARDLTTDKTRTMVPAAKEGYSPYEQSLGEGKTGPWTDVYALCATLWYCMKGTPPTSPRELLYTGRSLDWPGIRGLSKKQAAALQKGTALKAEDRTQSIQELMDALEDTGRKPSVKVWLLAVLCTALAGVLALTFLGQDRGPKTLASDEVSVETDLDACTEPVFGSEYLRNEIYTITFHDDQKTVPDQGSWDVSMARDGGVLAWVEPAEGDISALTGTVGEDALPMPEKLYHLHIAGKGTVQAPENCARLFKGYSSLTELHFDGNFRTDGVTTMRAMFMYCANLKTLDLSDFDTEQVTDMSWMFNKCASLNALELSKFDTARVTSMNSMFAGCEALTAVDVSAFHTTMVTDMGWMFGNCRSLETLDVSGFDTSHVTSMRTMFQNCEALTALDVSRWNTEQVTDMSYMFINCGKLSELDLSGWVLSAVGEYKNFMNSGKIVNGQPWKRLFQPEVELQSDTIAYDAAAIYTAPVFGSTIARNEVCTITFYNSQERAPANRSWDVSAAQDGSILAWVEESKTDPASLYLTVEEQTVPAPAKLYDLYIAGRGTVLAPKSCRGLFMGYSSLTEIHFNDNFYTDAVTDMYLMFYNCINLGQLELSHFRTEQVTDMGFLFSGCCRMTQVDVSSFDTSRVESMRCMFQVCTSLQQVDVSGFDTAQVTDMGYVFFKCPNLAEPDLSGWTVSQVQNHENFMSSDKTINGSPWEAFFD